MLSDLDIEIAKAFCQFFCTYHDPTGSIGALATLYKKHPKEDSLRMAVLPFIQNLIEDFKRQPEGRALKIRLIKDNKIQLENPRDGLARAVNNAHIPFSTGLIQHFVDNFVKDVRNRADTL